NNSPTFCTNCIKMHEMHELIQNAQNARFAGIIAQRRALGLYSRAFEQVLDQHPASSAPAARVCCLPQIVKLRGMSFIDRDGQVVLRYAKTRADERRIPNEFGRPRLPQLCECSLQSLARDRRTLTPLSRKFPDFTLDIFLNGDIG